MNVSYCSTGRYINQVKYCFDKVNCLNGVCVIGNIDVHMQMRTYRLFQICFDMKRRSGDGQSKRMSYLLMRNHIRFAGREKVCRQDENVISLIYT